MYLLIAQPTATVHSDSFYTFFMVSFFELDLPLDVMVISQYCRVDTQRGVTQQIVLLKMKQLSINYSSNDETCISVRFNSVYL